MTRLVSLLAFLVAAATGCSKNIGDSCTTNVDCKIDGTRFCDLAPPGGYCTVEGCDTGTCPTEAVCIRFYTPILDEPCTYDPCNAQGASDGTMCAPDERCECDETNDAVLASMTCIETGEPGIVCTSKTAHCAPENSEQRWCMKKCGNNGDCRDHYECRSTGTLGAEPVPDLEHPYGQPAKFCVSSGNQDSDNDVMPSTTTH